MQRCSFSSEAVSKVQYRSAPSELFRVSSRRALLFHLLGNISRGGLCVRVCVLRLKREKEERGTGRRTAREESMWQSAVDTLVMVLGGVTRLAMLSGVSPLMKVVTSHGPHLLKPRLPRRIQGYRWQHQQQRPAGSSDGEPPRCNPTCDQGFIV